IRTAGTMPRIPRIPRERERGVRAMSAEALLSMLTARGVTLRRAPLGRLCVEAPPGILTADLRADLARHRDAILATLDDADLKQLLPAWRACWGTLPV